MTEAGPARRTVGIRTGGRSERVVTSILGAALAELADVGYGAMRLEDVAARAGVAKTTVYRRWPTKADLVQAAVREAANYDEPLPDTGSLRKDMLIMVENAMKLIATPEGRALARLVTTEGGNPEVEQLCRRLKDESRAYRAQLVIRAQERGELPRESDPFLVMDGVFALVMSRLVRFNEQLSRDTCERLIDLIVTGAEHGGGQLRPRRTKRSA
jgi:AcrR family transcriptional regulator